MNSKKGIEFGFAWLFAIIVGAAIIFIAIFTTTDIIRTENTRTSSIAAAELGVLLNPIETSLESGKKAVITFSSETRLLNSCREDGNFGRQGLRTSVKTGLGSDWPAPGEETVFFNKYIFSGRIEEGKELHVFAKPLEIPYKITDLIFVSAKDYCFVKPPEKIEDEVLDLDLENVMIAEERNECSPEAESVCFLDRGCDVDVDLQSKRVTKQGESVYYVEGSEEGNALMYAAIFSDPGIYECQVKRLMKRAGEIAHLYSEKSSFLSLKGCPSNLADELINFAETTNIESSFDLIAVQEASENLNRRNNALSCELF